MGAVSNVVYLSHTQETQSSTRLVTAKLIMKHQFQHVYRSHLWRTGLLKYIDKEQLPSLYGGRGHLQSMRHILLPVYKFLSRVLDKLAFSLVLKLSAM